MKTKEEVIKIAYGIQWDNVKDYVEEMGHTVIGIVSSFEEALSFCDEQPDFVFLDIRMHGKDEGFKIAKDYVDENIVEREFPHPKFTLEFNKEWWLKYVTHYQEKIVPHKPLHK